MAPKPASTAGKAPASTASKAPAKPTEGAKSAKKTSKPAASTGEDGKKKRRKARKETYSSYIYKGMSCLWATNGSLSDVQSLSKFTLIRVSQTRPWPFSTHSSTISLSALLPRHQVRLNIVWRSFSLIWLLSELASYSKKSTISSREIQTAVRLILPGELAKHAISEGTKSVTKVCTWFLL